MTLLFLPISKWGPTPARDLVARDEILQHKHVYLNTQLFLARAALYFLVWNAISYFSTRVTEQGPDREPHLSQR